MTSRLRVSRPEELLSLIPYQLGFEPQDSIVIVCLLGPRRQVGLIARVDQADLNGPEYATVARQLLTQCLAQRATQVVLVAYGDRHGGADSTVSRCVDAVSKLRSITDPYLHVYEQWLVHAQEFGQIALAGKCLGNANPSEATDERAFGDGSHVAEASRDDANHDGAGANAPHMCSCHRASTSNFRDTEVAARMVFEGVASANKREHVGMIVEADTTRRAAVKEHAANLELQPKAVLGKKALAAWNSGLEQTGIVPAEAIALFTTGLKCIPLRDAILISMTSGGMSNARKFLEAQAMSPHDVDVDELARSAVAEITDPRVAKSPDRRKIARIRDMLEQTIACAQGSEHVAPRTLLALAAWWSGQDVLAQRHLEEAAKFDAEYGLAQLIRSAITHGLAPGWQRAQIQNKVN